MNEKPHPIKAWLICARIFALPWIATNVLVGVSLAGFSLEKWLLGFLVVGSVLISAHFFNAYFDFIKGFDKVEGGSKPKPYTAGNQVLPRGWLSLRTVKISTFAWLIVSLILMFFAPRRIDVYLLYALGVFVAFAYSLWFKPKGFGEVALFLGHGFGASTFAYSLVKPVTGEALAAGALLGLLAGVVYTVDQWVDAETDFARRVKNYAYLIAKAEMRLSTFFYFAVTAVVTIHIAFVLMGILRASTLKALLLMPLFHFTGVLLDYQFEKGVWVALTAIWFYPILMAL